MKRNTKWMPAVLAVVGFGVAVVSNGCSAANALCCKQYNPGTDMSKVQFTADAQVNAQFQALAQAAGDLAAVAGAAQADVANACKNIAVDLGEAADDPDMGANDLVGYWCGRAKAQIAATGLTVKIDPVAINCSASVQAQVDCKARCDVMGKCDLKVNPPKCTGGKLEVSCKGGCTAEGSAPSVSCTGSCSAMCQGTCEASGGAMVNCDGRCDGICMGTLGMDGNCTGQCQGKCTMKANASVMCTGTCSGGCTGKCTASPGSLTVKCDGKCDADFEPISCTGGKLEGGCMVDAKCEGSCSASASAKAECTPPTIRVSITGTGMKAPILRATLEANLGVVAIVFRARGQAFLDTIKAVGTIGGQITASGKLDVGGTACIGFIADNVVTTTTSFTATLNAAGQIGTMVGM